MGKKNTSWLVGKAQRGSSVDLRGLACMAALSAAVSLGAWSSHWIWPAKAQPSTVEAASPLQPLPLAVLEEESHMDLARRLANLDTFMALALSVENVPKTAYVDAAGANAGAGYCIEARRRAHGSDKVKADLRKAGFAEAEIADLLSRESARIERVKVGKAQALRLLAMTKPHYESMAREALGAKTFDALPSHKQDVLSYLAYNTGGPKKFVKLLRAVKEKDEVAALSQLAPSIRTEDGHALKNHRLRAWAQAAWVGTAELEAALSRPLAFEKNFAGKRGQEKFIHARMAFFNAGAKLAGRRDAQSHGELPSARLRR